MQGASATSGAWRDLNGVSASFAGSANDDDALLLDLVQPTVRYVRPVVHPSTNAAGTVEFGGAGVLRYSGKYMPASHSTSSVVGYTLSIGAT